MMQSIPWVKGGAEKRIYELSQRMAARGHTVHCYGMKWWQGENEILRDGVHLHGICQPMPLYSGGRRSMKEAAYFAGKVLSARVDCDIVDCQNFPYLSCFSAKLLTTLKRRNLFITWHEVWGDYWYEYLGKKGFLGEYIEKAAARLTEKNIAVSERTRQELESLEEQSRSRLCQTASTGRKLSGFGPQRSSRILFVREGWFGTRT